MNPKSLKQHLETYVNTASRRYVEEHIDLIDTDLQKFVDDCPEVIKDQVIKILEDADIDLSDVVISANNTKWWYDSNTYTTKQYVYESTSNSYDVWWNSGWKVKEVFND